jgi:hypothetical protein
MVPTIPGVSTALGNQVIGQRMMRAMSVVPSSLGPELPIDDDEVHAWTAVFDDYLSKGGCLATVAAGNGGEGDDAIGANRVQVPADCVNALAAGAADSPDTP